MFWVIVLYVPIHYLTFSSRLSFDENCETMLYFTYSYNFCSKIYMRHVRAA